MRLLLALVFICTFWTGAIAQTLRPGDTIQVSVFQDPKLDRQLVIDRGGMIAFPLAGHIHAGGLTTRGLESALKRSLSDKYSSDLDITVAVIASERDDDDKPRIFVTGEVKAPGTYPIRTKVNVLQAIALSGGLGPFAAKRRIQVRRRINGIESVVLFDYDAFESGKDLDGNVDLRAGDVVIVPERGVLE